MADNFQVRDGNGNLITMKSKDSTGSGGPTVPQSVPSDATGNPIADSNPLATAVQGRAVTYIERSAGLNSSPASIPTTSTQILGANTSRRAFFIQNLDANNFIYINFGAAAVAGPGSIAIPPYSIYESPVHMISTSVVYAISSAGTVLYTCKEA